MITCRGTRVGGYFLRVHATVSRPLCLHHALSLRRQRQTDGCSVYAKRSLFVFRHVRMDLGTEARSVKKEAGRQEKMMEVKVSANR